MKSEETNHSEVRATKRHRTSESEYPKPHAPHQAGPPKGEEFFTLANGCPIMNPNAALRIGRSHDSRSTLLLQDTNLIQNITHFTRERIPGRVVHERAIGAYGEFEVTHDISDITSAAFLSKVGKKTPLFCRLSNAVGERGSADSARDIRGFAFKLYTQEGNLDWAFLNTPTFPIRDPGKFPGTFHALGRNPQNNLKDANFTFDFFNNNPEAYGALLFLFSDRGTPVSYRFTDIFSVNTYKFTKPDGSFKYVKIHMKANEGAKNLTNAQTVLITGQDPDYYRRDMFLAIENGNFPSWTVYAQVIDPHKAERLNAPIFDPTKTISETDFPLVPFGKITLNRNPENTFAEVEQAAFCPSSVVPGWEITPDPILQLRLFAYGDAQRYRLGVNFNQLPVNKPLYAYNPTRRDGASNIDNLGSMPGYFPSSFGPKIAKPAQVEELAAHEEWVGRVTSFESHVTDKDFVQPREFWEELGREKGQQKNLVQNLAGILSAADKKIREASYAIFKKIDKDLGKRVKKATEERVIELKSGEEIPGIIVGGDITSRAEISGVCGDE